MWNSLLILSLFTPLLLPGELRRALRSFKRLTPVSAGIALRDALIFFLPLLPFILLVWGHYNSTYGNHAPRFVNFEEFLHIFFWQLLAVALPEEFFFRRFFLRRLDLIFHRRLRLWNTRFGPGLFLAAGAFAFAHVFAWMHPAGLVRFFPGVLFGFVYERRRSLLSAVFLHLLCNLSVMLWA